MNEAKVPLVLVSNDDGIDAPGLEAMVVALRSWADVLVVAPMVEQSACSHKLSLNMPLRLKQVGYMRWALDGTPADCVYVGLNRGQPVADRSVDLVVAGVNRGLNLGLDIHYSGTVAAAREAALRGVSGLAVSADRLDDSGHAARVASVVAKVMVHRRERLRTGASPIVVNMNVPVGAPLRLRAVRLGRRYYEDSVDVRTDPRGGEYLWIGGTRVDNDMTAGTDTAAYETGLIGLSRVPLLPEDCTDERELRSLVTEANELLAVEDSRT